MVAISRTPWMRCQCQFKYIRARRNTIYSVADRQIGRSYSSLASTGTISDLFLFEPRMQSVCEHVAV